ncbi:hypothetical protein HKX48_005858 [Thoreauomyces humboldtii]|nr:hypothetical protein HKX48_005858 [Thoreauomyces humboldtii]
MATVQEVIIPIPSDALDCPIRATLFSPPRTDDNIPCVLLSSASGVPRSFYLRFATYLAAEYGIPVLTYDYRGHGESLPPNGLYGLRNLSIWKHWGLVDQKLATAFLHETFPNRPMTCLGHSVGCHIMPLNPLRHLFSRYVYIAAANAHYRYAEKPFASWMFVPLRIAAVPLGYFPSRRLGLCEDIPLGIAKDWAEWIRVPAYCTSQPEVKEAYDTFEPPSAMSLAFTDDHFIRKNDLAAYRMLHVLMPKANIPFRLVDPADVGSTMVGHTGFFKPAVRQGWDMVAKFIVEGVEPDVPLTTFEPETKALKARL